MQQWDEARRQARVRHATALAMSGDPAARALLAAAEGLTGVARIPVAAGDPLLDGAEALLDTASGVIVFAADAEPWRALFYQAHEYAHLWIDGGRAACAGADLDAETGEKAQEIGAGRVEGYGPRERREREATVFALEFLLPCPLLRRWYLDEGLNAPAIAERTGLPVSLIFEQLTQALLLPPAPPDVGHAPPTDLPLDDSQSTAARAPRGPVLVEAGPGTGKTRTLVARVLHLLEQGHPASSILALTFSQRAAEEMRGRVARSAPEAAAALWAGTFHAFGLELLRKFGTRLGLPPAPGVLDPLDALLWLEHHLAELDLNHYLNLNEPAQPLRDILAAISRAKDELVGPREYADLAGRMHATATTEAEVQAAERALEVARVYAFYQEQLQRSGRLDFGDLIYRAVTLLREHPDVHEAVRGSYAHVLVDEYQDVNRASALLLREVAGDGAGLWVVGDARQAIYRFRGAAPDNMRLFRADYPNATVLTLGHNYRSRPGIVGAISEVASRMRATSGLPFNAWQAHRPATGKNLRLDTASDSNAEVLGLARAIQERRAQGVSYGDQAVLCRTHTMLARIADGLAAAGIPLLYLGDVFERPEVRDLLALLSLAADGNGHGLVRVAGFPEYAIPMDDVQRVLALAHMEGRPFPGALALVEDAYGISQQGKAGLSLLSRHLDGICFGTGPWSFLVQYLFARSGYPRPLMKDSPSAAQRRLSLYRFLQFAQSWRNPPSLESDDPKAAFLRYLRRLESFGEEKGLRQVPEWAAQSDAVRLLTIHASKGLEFDTVYLPALAQRYFPAPRQREPCPPPAGMLPHSQDEMHDEEEECLFFVAISRARDRLYLSHARRYGRQGSKPSRLLELLGAALSQRSDDSVASTSDDTASGDECLPTPTNRDDLVLDAEQLELYLRCPRRYYYDAVLGLRGSGDGDAREQYRRCLRQVLVWLRQQESEGREVDTAAAQAYLDSTWQANGPRGHPHEALYRREAEALVARALRRSVSRPEHPIRDTRWEIALPHGRVSLSPDRLEVGKEGATETVLVRRITTGKAGDRERQRRLEALYHEGARQAYPTAARRVRIVSLATDEVREVEERPRAIAAALEEYDQALEGIASGAFNPRPDERVCPRCPHYFICNSTDDAT
ncbi:MAG TPA: UvrD-helicase domain-containing protein [Chloroflexota bacterium]|nr:UvrD-helicase domain-containing protein [Chloroflexota bacterium]